MELPDLMMKKLQEHSISVFVTLIKTYHYQRTLRLRKILLYLHYTDPVVLALRKYKGHPGKASITIKMTSMDNPKFSFRCVSLNEILDGATGIFVEIIKQNKDVVSFYVFHNFSNALPSCFFSTALKYADIRLVFKKDDKTDKKNYRPITILPNVSKVYERLLYQCITKCVLF